MRLQLAAAAILTSLAAPAEPPQQMRFGVLNTVDELDLREWDGGQVRISATGPIDAGAADRLKAFVRRQGIDSAKIYLDSPGGSLRGAVALGEAIRTLKFDTQVEAMNWQLWDPPTATCANECVYAFAGGVYRFFFDSSGRMGLGEPETAQDDQDESPQYARRTLTAYLQRMGVDSGVLALWWARHSTVVQFSVDQAESLRLANNGTQATNAKTKYDNGRPYLSLEQVHFNFTARARLSCSKGRLRVSGAVLPAPDLTQDQASEARRSYLELNDDRQIMPIPGSRGLRQDGNMLWVSRDIAPRLRRDLARADTLGSWVDLSYMWRRGAWIDLRPVRPKIEKFLEACR